MIQRDDVPDAPDWRYTPPNAGPMPARRILQDACRACGVSEVACDAAWYVSKEACCSDCGGH